MPTPPNNNNNTSRGKMSYFLDLPQCTENNRQCYQIPLYVF
uniref:DIPLA1-antisense expressed n=1 Tax=Homo sapiens TaxID=9606 RepID=Q5QFB8_HUMAN|nr:DIPLA1-antisense expressed [Homo sapiens]